MAPATERQPSQRERILAILQARPEGITPGQALDEVGCFRLASRISELREAGHIIDTLDHRTAGGAIVARYVLRRPAIAAPTTGEQLGLM